MNIDVLKQEFINDLTGLYPSEEIQSFFNFLSEKYLRWSRIEIALHPQREVSKENSEKFKDAIKRLQEFEPIQYIIGETEFYGLPFLVDNTVLIPRHETEELVDWIVKKSTEKRGKNKDEIILDIGTGSGCIAISLAHSLPNALITAIDISEGALRIAKQNAILNNVAINFVEADVLKHDNDSWSLIFKDLNFDAIVSNPPYVREQEKSQIEPNVIKHEPGTALFVNDKDPLLFYRRIAHLSQKFLKPEGALYFEINEYLSKELMIFLKNEGFNEVTLRKDIFGKDRMIKCKR